jgi:serine/threonine protein kinase
VNQFRGTDRFAIQRRLGSGSFGAVYEAFDYERQTKVALKVPHEASALNIYLFKQEFRALADVSHPNLVNLYELIAQGQEWFFTMELVDGKNFLEHLCPDQVGTAASQVARRFREPSLGSVFGQGSSGGLGEAGELILDSPVPGAAPKVPAPVAPPDYGAVRVVLRQLVEGLRALHQIGQLHGDLKPTNVLVALGGRVVLLDFGLTLDLGLTRGESAHFRGTPAYMAPEQIGGHAPTEASDWYSVGVMLYQVLTGNLPFPGNNLSSVINKMRMDPPAPAALLPETPEDLNDLCMDLLKRKPDLRPAGPDILERLGGSPDGAPLRIPTSARIRSSNLLLGREEELATLGQAFERSQQGKTVMVFLEGGSGMGKSYLVRRYLRDLQREEPRAVLLIGRCYEQESVPYKALDSLVDALSQYLKELPHAKAAPLLPRHILSLARLFPVLNQVQAIAEFQSSTPPAPDPQELRRRAFGALRDLLCRLGDRFPLVLVIDDLQWGDPDSASLLANLFRAPNPPSMLVLATYRTPEGAPAPELLAFQERLREEGAEILAIRLGDLTGEEARKLAMALLGSACPDAGEAARRITEVARGNPFFIVELARNLRTGLEPDGHGDPLEGYIRTRVEALPEGSRNLLELLALAGQPLEWDVLKRASGLADPEEALTHLRGGHLIRIRGAQRQLLETHHDRMRQAVLRGLAPDRARGLHLQLAQALAMAPAQDAQALALHFQAAGEIATAAQYAFQAAEEALGAIAFERAAFLFQKALDLGAPKGRAYRDLVVKLGDAQAHAGAGMEAARSYLKAVAGSTAYEVTRLRRRASEEFFRCGQFDQGLATLKDVLSTFGMGVPASPFQALLSVVGSRLRLRIRGYAFQERRESQVPQADLDRIDCCWAAAMGLTPIDLIRGGAFQARQLLFALDAGEPFRLVRALAFETIFLAHRGNRSLKATQRVQAITLALAERIGHPNPMSRAFIAAGTAALMQGRWKAAVDLLQRAETLLREHCTGLDYELHIAQHLALMAHLVLGHIREVELRLSSRLQAAREKGNLLAITNLRVSVAPYLHLAQDDPARAMREVTQGIRDWSTSGFHLQHFHALTATVNVLLYLGEPTRAWEALEGQGKALRHSLLLRAQVLRLIHLELRARTALALVFQGGAEDREGLLRGAHDSIHALESERTAYGEALALKLQAMEALVLDRPEEAGALFFQAEIAFQSCDMGLQAAVVRRCRGRLEGTPGADHLEAAEKWMAGQGIVEPGKFAAMYVLDLDA